MSTNAQVALYLLWFAHPVLQLAILGMMFWRKLHRIFPVFFSYIALQVATFAFTFPLRYHPAFFYFYWITTAISVVVGFGVIHEVFLDVFRPYHTLRDLGSVLFKWAGLVMLMVAAVVAASTSPAMQEPIVAGITTLQRSVRVVQCGLVLFLLVFSRYLGTHWRQKSFGIAIGFGMFASVELSLVALNSSAVLSQDMTSIINMVAYNATLMIWMGYMTVTSPERAPSTHMLRPQRWEEGLNAIQHPHSPDSLIPMFESIVDRALSGTQVEPALPELNRSRSHSPEDSRRRTQAQYPPLTHRVGSKG